MKWESVSDINVQICDNSSIQLFIISVLPSTGKKPITDTAQETNTGTHSNHREARTKRLSKK